MVPEVLELLLGKFGKKGSQRHPILETDVPRQIPQRVQVLSPLRGRTVSFSPSCQRKDPEGSLLGRPAPVCKQFGLGPGHKLVARLSFLSS